MGALWGEPDPVCVNVMVPVRGPVIRILVTLTSTVQDAPGARLVPVQVSAPFTFVN